MRVWKGGTLYNTLLALAGVLRIFQPIETVTA